MGSEMCIRDSGRAKLYADIAHPVNAACREMIQDCVIEHYNRELELSKDPSYRSRYDDGYDSAVKTRVDQPQSEPKQASSPPQQSKTNESQSPQSGSGFGNGIVD